LKKRYKNLDEYFRTLSFDEKLKFLFKPGKMRVPRKPPPADPAKGVEEAITLSEMMKTAFTVSRES
jgi:hypothetical protein